MAEDWKPGWLAVRYWPCEDGGMLVRLPGATRPPCSFSAAEATKVVKERVRSEDDEF